MQRYLRPTLCMMRGAASSSQTPPSPPLRARGGRRGGTGLMTRAAPSDTDQLCGASSMSPAVPKPLSPGPGVDPLHPTPSDISPRVPAAGTSTVAMCTGHGGMDPSTQGLRYDAQLAQKGMAPTGQLPPFPPPTHVPTRDVRGGWTKPPLGWGLVTAPGAPGAAGRALGPLCANSCSVRHSDVPPELFALFGSAVPLTA